MCGSWCFSLKVQVLVLVWHKRLSLLVGRDAGPLHVSHVLLVLLGLLREHGVWACHTPPVD